jgi:DNA-directed RNA polymerase subunit RPC12/RpoP
MPIELKCKCGRAMRLKDDAAGRKIRCPDCETMLLVPQPVDADEPDVVDDSEIVEETAQPRKMTPPPLPPKALSKSSGGSPVRNRD